MVYNGNFDINLHIYENSHAESVWYRPSMIDWNDAAGYKLQLPCVQKKMSPLNIFVLASEKLSWIESAIKRTVHKPASIWVIVPKFCKTPPYRLIYFQFLVNLVTNCIFPRYCLTSWRTALMSCMMSSCVDKQNAARKQGFNSSTQSW